MKNFRTFLTVFLSLNIIIIYGQDNPKPKKILLKLYINGYYRQIEDNDYKGFLTGFDDYKHELKKYDFWIPSFAVEFQRDKFFMHEIELMPINFDLKNETETLIYYDTLVDNVLLKGSKNTTFESYFRYQLNYYLVKGKVITPIIGLSAKAFYDFSKIYPYISNEYENTVQNLGMLFAISPGVRFKIAEKFSLDLTIPIGFYEFKLNMENYENPGIALNDRKSTKIIGDFMPKYYNLRVGLTYKI